MFSVRITSTDCVAVLVYVQSMNSQYVLFCRFDIGYHYGIPVRMCLLFLVEVHSTESKYGIVVGLIYVYSTELQYGVLFCLVEVIHTESKYGCFWCL